jgi:hypothetical protein
MADRVARLLLVGLLAVPLALGGCAAQPATRRAQDPVLGSLPADLTIDVTILPGTGLGALSAAHLARSKYILFPDGSVHGDEGASMGVLVRPARVRVLTREEMADVWFIARETGFADLDAADFDGNPALLAPSRDEVLTILSVTADGRSRTFVRRSAPADVDASTRRMVRTLAALAFASDEPGFDRVIMPLRYDLGPDPYRRFLPPEPIRPSRS